MYNSRLHLFHGKLKSRWSGPFEISNVLPYEVLEQKKQDMGIFKTNTHRVKAYHEGFQQVQTMVHHLLPCLLRHHDGVCLLVPSVELL